MSIRRQEWLLLKTDVSMSLLMASQILAIYNLKEFTLKMEEQAMIDIQNNELRGLT